MRREFEMSPDQLERLLATARVATVPRGERMWASANRAWADLGEELSFDWTTVEPIDRKTERHFTAVVAGGAE